MDVATFFFRTSIIWECSSNLSTIERPWTYGFHQTKYGFAEKVVCKDYPRFGSYAQIIVKGIIYKAILWNQLRNTTLIFDAIKTIYFRYITVYIDVVYIVLVSKCYSSAMRNTYRDAKGNVQQFKLFDLYKFGDSYLYRRMTRTELRW